MACSMPATAARSRPATKRSRKRSALPAATARAPNPFHSRRAVSQPPGRKVPRMATPNESPLSFGDRCAVEFTVHVGDNKYEPRTFYGFFRGWVFGDPNAASEAFVQYD